MSIKLLSLQQSLLLIALEYLSTIQKRRGHAKAIIAIACMMMVSIYHMISEKKLFEPTDYEELMDP